MGIEAVRKQAESNVLLLGLKSLGLEVAKNLVLSGLKKLTIFDDEPIINTSEHFYMADLKSNNIKDCIFKLKELNPYMVIDYSEKLANLAAYSIVVSTLSYNRSKSIAEQISTQQLKTKFIYTETKGVSGIYFADLGKHAVNDDNG